MLVPWDVFMVMHFKLIKIDGVVNHACPLGCMHSPGRVVQAEQRAGWTPFGSYCVLAGRRRFLSDRWNVQPKHAGRIGRSHLPNTYCFMSECKCLKYCYRKTVQKKDKYDKRRFVCEAKFSFWSRGAIKVSLLPSVHD